MPLPRTESQLNQSQAEAIFSAPRVDTAAEVPGEVVEQEFPTLGEGVRYWGPRLSQFDYRVLMTIFQIERLTPTPGQALISRRSLLLELGYSVSTRAYAHLDASLGRLTRGQLRRANPDTGESWTTALISECTVGPGVLDVKLSPLVVGLANAAVSPSAHLDAFRTVNPGLASRLAVLCERSPSGFSKDLPTLMQQLSVHSPTVNKFAKLLRAALPKLVDAKVIATWHVRKGVLTVTRHAS